MNALVPQGFGAVSSVFAGVAPANNDLGAGINAGYGIVKYKGKVWSLNYQGAEHKVMRADGDGPRNSIEVVIVKAPSHVSKVFYANGYQEGSTEAPDCFSHNGIMPDPSSKAKQATACASCPQNVWGAKVNAATGKAGKACSDSKRIAIVPLEDVANSRFGGPMLLRVPASSLRALADYGKKVSSYGYHYFAIGTKISFDPNEAYPKFTFDAVRALTDDEARVIKEHMESEQVVNILAEGTETPAPQAIAPPAGLFTAAPADPAPVKTVAAPAPAPVATPAPTVTAPPAAPVGESDFEKSLDEQLAGLLGD